MEPDGTGRYDDDGGRAASVPGGGSERAGQDQESHEGYLSILEQVEAELADVEHALKRLDDGTYGVCEACGEAISPPRLDSSPAARLCAKDDNPAALRFF